MPSDDGAARPRQVDDFYKMDGAVEAHMRCPRVCNALRELLGEDIDAYQVATITKPAEFGWEGGGCETPAAP